jgi:diguanylate cyclase
MRQNKRMANVEQGERPQEEGLRFVRRMYLPRVFGLALGAVCIAGGLWQQHAPAMAYALLLVNALAWPHLAYPLATRSANPYRAELRNLMVDSASGGLWIAYIGFNFVPSAVLVAMLAMDKVSIGGLRLLARCLAAQALAAAAVVLAFGFRLEAVTTVPAVLASLPLLVAYPVTVGLTTYRLSRRVRQQNQLLVALSSTDGLTGLFNRSHWEQAVITEFQRCRRIGHASAVMMLDIDHFKAVNDGHGHPAGDKVIRAVAAILRDTLRIHDVAGRYGGEEFGVILAGADALGSVVTAERIRKRVESSLLVAQTSLRVTVSIGVAALDPADADYSAWIARADRALYMAKEAGRNRSVQHVPGYAEGSVNS